jgi:hypothetical protein
MTVASFDHETYPDPLDAALWTLDHPLRPEERAELYRANTAELEWYGPPAPVASIAVERDAAGTFVTLAGRRIPAEQDGDLLRIGRPEWLGRCPIAAATACAALLHLGLADVEYVTGRVFGGRQCFATFRQDGRPFVLDLSLTDEPWPLADYTAALHATVGRRTPISTYADLDRLHGRIVAELC